MNFHVSAVLLYKSLLALSDTTIKLTAKQSHGVTRRINYLYTVKCICSL